MISLNEDLLIGKGKERYCFQHPDYQDVCVKITRDTRNRKYEENKKEYEYFNKYFQNCNEKLPIAAPLKWVATNYGKGLSYQKIQDYNGKISRTLGDMLKDNSISLEKVIVEMLVLKDVFLEKLVCPIDLNLGNIVLQQFSETEHRLVLIDGYGTKNLIPVMKISKSLGRKQIARRFDKQIAELLKEYNAKK